MYITCMYMYVCMYVYMYVCMYICMYVCMYVHMYMYVVCMYVCTCMYVCMYVCKLVCIIYTHTLRIKGSGTQSTNQVYYERVSPPPSDFLMEDAVVISALDKYSNIKRSMDNLTDDQILAIEEDKGWVYCKYVLCIFVCTCIL